jgi:hypothetical protein
MDLRRGPRTVTRGAVTRGALVVLALCASSAVAHAYPQFQLSHDTTCTACHLAPDGGGLLNENGLAVAEATAWKSNDSAFLHGVLSEPAWLVLGGDVRLAGGFVDNGSPSGGGYPMQAEIHAAATKGEFSFNATGGLRRPLDGGNALHVLWSREHYAMWARTAEKYGIYVRAGRLMPTFGLRLAEHVVYTQRYGGRPLYGEAYALAASYVSSGFEVHATGFVHDPISTEVEHGDGGALYAEARLGEHAAIGAEGKYSKADDAKRAYGGITAKLYLPGPDLLLLGEAQLIRQRIPVGAGDRFTQVAAYILASRPFGSGILVDAGVGHFTQDTRVKGLTRDCLDVNVHWFTTSHLEWLLTTRVELLDAGGGPNGGYALVQLHYRL